jgi:hypothetical protein
MEWAGSHHDVIIVGTGSFLSGYLLSWCHLFGSLLKEIVYQSFRRYKYRIFWVRIRQVLQVQWDTDHRRRIRVSSGRKIFFFRGRPHDRLMLPELFSERNILEIQSIRLLAVLRYLHSFD